MEKSPKFHFILGRRISRWLIDRLSDRVICISEAVRRQFDHYAEQNPNRYWLIYNAIPRPERMTLLPGPPSLVGEEAGVEKNSLSPDEKTESTSRPIHLQVPPTACNGRPVRKAEGFTIGYIGRLSEGKGFHILLAAMARLKQWHIPAELLVAGEFVDAPYEARIRRMIAENDLAARVRFLGYKKDIAPLYEALDALVVPSLHEPFGRVVIEAMVHGAPCVAADAGGIPELIAPGLTGLLYPPEDPDALAERLESLIASDSLAEMLRRNGQQSVYERFNIEVQIGKLDACYQSVISRQS